jgi:CheY-like chemotaxis protein
MQSSTVSLKSSSKREFEGKILLIEDSIFHSALLEDQLCVRMGFPKESIILATDGKQALKILSENIDDHCSDPRKKIFSLIIADYNIPFITGQEVL